MTNPYASLGPAEFAAGAANLLPQGPAWPRDPASVQARAVAGIADSLAAAHARSVALTEAESDPLQTLELLPEWERDWGLPDPCLPLDASVAQRRGALVARMAEGADPTPAYFEALALSIGYVVTVTPDDGSYGAGAEHVWHINAATITAQHAHAGANVAGDYLEVQGNGFLECVIRRAAPAHSIVIFDYS